jgi:hypothetical protein
MVRLAVFVLYLGWGTVSQLLSAEPTTNSTSPSFSRDILPILSSYCFNCHGLDEKSREADLRLDRENDALRTVNPVIVRGESAKSELIKRIISTDPDSIMPPPSTKKQLKPHEIELLKQWIDSGASWGKHWAFEVPQRPKLSDSKLNPIDELVARKHLTEKLSISAEAPRHTLIRRVTLDLTGLPPTPDEVQAFVNDQSADAYEKVVDRLLASPRYGERMAWDWLEAGRYADTNGYQGDPTRAMWYWRDWLVKALNDNKPFDEFTIEMLAGDLLPNPTQEQLIATGFHRNHMINGEGCRIAEESRVDYVQDRVETTGTVWLGLSFNCCRCHSHKFDPITNSEYYQLSAYFNSIEETGSNDAGGLANPIITMSSDQQKAELAKLQESEKVASKARDELEKQLRAKQPDWEKSFLANAATQPDWQSLKPTTANSEHGTSLRIRDDASILATDKNPAEDSYTIIYNVKHGKITALLLEALPDESLPAKGPGRAENGNFVLNEVSLHVGDKSIPLLGKQVDFAQKSFSADATTDGKLNTGWAIMPAFGEKHTLLLTLNEPLDTTNETTLTIKLTCKFGREHNLGCFRLLATTLAKPQIESAPEAIRNIIKVDSKIRNAEQKKQLYEYYRGLQPEYAAAKKHHEDAKKAREEYEKKLPRTMVMRERSEPRKTFMLWRGVYSKPGDEVQHGVPAILNPLPADAPKNRLALARWLVAPENPLMARVTVNRIWQQFFGIGLVKTVEDFGVQGEKPIHPELLDWLALELQQASIAQPSVAHANRPNNWNIKHLHRLIVTSRTYRQTSHAAPAMYERDPTNRLHARGPRYRMPSWMIRDQALAVSGLIVEKLGGPPVKGYQPDGIWEEATFGTIKYQQDHGEALYRRSLYQFWRRIVGPTVFFDTPNRQNCQVKASRTNTPLHALTTLNDVTYVEAARCWAERLLTAKLTDEERLKLAFEQLLSRTPTEHEIQVLLKSLTQYQNHFDKEPNAAKKLLSLGEKKRDEQLATTDLAAWTTLTNVLLNLDEALTKE